MKIIKVENGDAIISNDNSVIEDNTNTEELVSTLNNQQNDDSNDSFVFPTGDEPSTSACNINENDVTVDGSYSQASTIKLREELSDSGDITPDLNELEQISAVEKREDFSDGGDATPDIDELEQNNEICKEDIPDTSEQNVSTVKKEELSDEVDQDKPEQGVVKKEELPNDNIEDKSVDAGAGSSSACINTDTANAPADATDSNQPSSSTNKRKFRDRCAYGEKCYRLVLFIYDFDFLKFLIFNFFLHFSFL